jgi:hypothetical protein
MGLTSGAASATAIFWLTLGKILSHPGRIAVASRHLSSLVLPVTGPSTDFQEVAG